MEIFFRMPITCHSERIEVASDLIALNHTDQDRDRCSFSVHNQSENSFLRERRNRRAERIRDTYEEALIHTNHGYDNESLLGQLSFSTLADLQAITIFSHFKTGEVLFAERETVPAVFIIQSAKVRVSMTPVNRRSLTVQIAQPGRIIGLGSALSGQPAEWKAEVVDPGKIAWVNRTEFLDFLSIHAEVYPLLVSYLNYELTLVSRRLRTLGPSSSASERLARQLLEWGKSGRQTENGTQIRLRSTHAELAELLGVTRETVTRTLASFRQKHLVELEGPVLTIPSTEALKSCT